MISESEKEYILALLSHTDSETLMGIAALLLLFISFAINIYSEEHKNE